MCGIFGIINVQEAARFAAIGLHAIQHRAIDYAGIVSCDGVHFYRHGGAGVSRQVFTREKIESLHGKSALGHIRYPTVTDDETRDNIQPIVGVYNGKPIAIAHNGNLTNLQEFKEMVPELQLSTSMDTEYILRLLAARCTGNIEADLIEVLGLLKGSFSIGILLPDLLIAARDTKGNRPLSIGEFNGGYCISSEDCAFPSIKASKVHDVEAGTIVFMGLDGLKTKSFGKADRQQCRFEAIYYSHPSSTVFGENITRFRMEVGKRLEKLFPVPEADIVTPVPDSSNFMAMGYGESRCSGVYLPVIIRNHYVGRTFIAPTQAIRNNDVSQKFTFTEGEIFGKNIVVVDDSIVRGTTMPKIIKELRRLGARTVHVRIGSPPIIHPCTYGINTPCCEELIAAFCSPQEICQRIGADSLEFLTLEALKEVSSNSEHFCFACMDGKYW